MRNLLIATLAAVLLSPCGPALAAPPVFKQFPVAERFAGRSAPLHLRHPRDREFRTVLSAAARQPVNFAGHYVLTTIGCGAGCIMIATIDARDGTVAWLPFTLCCWDRAVAEPVRFRVDSRLMVLYGRRNEAGGAGPHYWQLKDGRYLAVHPGADAHAAQRGPARP